ncbi:DUF2497 domain-containing protein [Flavisphingomonas formosensis]|uniref:DUF2497 domain-containing protein n=1 Tax=Flavisphingomonas formosensis TaxID=861534 RepID=UPI0012FCEB8B|nr:DUF2497 domain-containing protein [Sphingomonas formosensis]
MGDVRHEPSMEDILASIKRIIAEDGAGPAPSPAARPRPRVVPDPEPSADSQDSVLELTQTVDVDQDGPLVSGDAAEASRAALARLATMSIKSEPGLDNTLEGLVRELLKPLLKEWLDANLPELVETLVTREIARITGTSL